MNSLNTSRCAVGSAVARMAVRLIVPIFILAVQAIHGGEPAPSAKPTNSTPPPGPTPAAMAKSAEAGWETLFDGRTLDGWRATEFGGHGEVHVERNFVAPTNQAGPKPPPGSLVPGPAIVLDLGSDLTGIHWTNDVPNMNYEIELEAMKVDGSDFFCGLTFPVKDSFCSFIVGGWGGGVVGLSSLDGNDASQNETTKFMGFQTGRWYLIRVRVTERRIQTWIDREKVVDVNTAEKRISLRPGEIEMSKPLGVASWQTSAALRNIKLRRFVNAPETDISPAVKKARPAADAAK